MEVKEVSAVITVQQIKSNYNLYIIYNIQYIVYNIIYQEKIQLFAIRLYGDDLLFVLLVIANHKNIIKL